MNQKIKQFLIVIIFLNLLIPFVFGAIGTFEPLTDFSDPQWFDTVMINQDGTLRADILRVPIVRSDQDTIGAIMIRNITINRGQIINNAKLKLYFSTDLDAGDSYISVYGIKAVYTNSDTLEGLTVSIPLTTAHTDINLNTVTSAQWVEIDVKSILSELVNQWNWVNGRSLAFVIYGSAQNTLRSFQANVGTNYPILNVTYGVTEGGGQGGFSGGYRDWNWTYTPPVAENPNIVGYAYDSQYYTGAPFYVNYCNFFTNIPVVNYTYLPSIHMTAGATEGNQQYLWINNTIYAVVLNVSSTDLDLHYSTDYGQTWNRLDYICDLGASLSCDAYAMATNDNDKITIVFVSGDGSGGNIYHTSYRLSTGERQARSQLYGSNYDVQRKPSLFWDNQTQLWFTAYGGATVASSTQATKITPFYDGNRTIPVGMTTETLTTTSGFGEVMRWDANNLICIDRKTNSPEYFRVWNLTEFVSNTWTQLTTVDDTLDIQYSDVDLGYDNESVKCIVIGFSAVIAGNNNPCYHVSYDGGSTWSALVYSDRNLDFRGASLWNYNGTLWSAFLEYSQFDIYLWQFQNIDNTDLDYQFIIPDSPNSQCDEIHIMEIPVIEGAGGSGVFNVTPPPDVDPVLVNCVTNYLSTNFGSDPSIYNETMIQEAIDHCDVDPDDPAPPDWDDPSDGFFTRGNMRMMFLILGFGLIFIPLAVLSMTKDKSLMLSYIWIMALCWVIGLALLWSIPNI